HGLGRDRHSSGDEPHPHLRPSARRRRVCGHVSSRSPRPARELGRGCVLSPLEGSCLCGGVRFDVTEPFLATSHCHCEYCKRIAGGYGTVSGRARTEAIRVLEGEELLRSYTPGEGSAKTFCSVCGSNLFGGGWPQSEEASIRLSAIDDPLPAPPVKHIYTRSV